MGIAVIIIDIYIICAMYTEAVELLRLSSSFLRCPAATLSIDSLCNLSLVPISSYLMWGWTRCSPEFLSTSPFCDSIIPDREVRY